MNSARPRPSGTPGSLRIRPTRRVVDAGCGQRSRHVDQLHTRRGGEQLGGALRRNRLGELGIDRQRVAGEHRHPHAGAADREVGDAEDLAALVAQLLVLVGLAGAVVDQLPGQRYHVERDRRDVLAGRREVHARRRRAPGLDAATITARACEASSSTPASAAARNRLVGRGDHPHQPRLVVQRLEHRHGGHGGAVRVGDDALGQPLAQHVAVEVDLADTTSGTSGSLRQAEELSITTAPASANRGACTRDMVAPAENSAMSSPLGSAVSASSTSISCAAERQLAARERAEAKNRTLVDREVALLEQRPHHRADLAGRADDSDGRTTAHRPVPAYTMARSSSPPRPNASCSARDGLVELRVLDQHRDSDLRGGDQLDVDPDLGQRLAERGGDAGVAAHARADQRHLADVVVVEHLG